MKLQRHSTVETVSARRLEASARTRFLDFPWGTNVGWPLREIGVRTVGIDRLHGNYKGGTPRSTTHLLYFVIQGSVRAQAEGEEFELCAGRWAVFPALSPHWIRNQRGKAEAVWVHLLDLPRWAGLKKKGSQTFEVGSPDRLHDTLLRAIEEAQCREAGSFENAMAYASIFRNLLIREFNRAMQRDEGRMRSRLVRLWSEVNSRLGEDWTVKKMSALVHVSESSLYQQVAACHGLRPMQMVAWLRMERAKDLLLHTGDKLQTIAGAVGYQTAYSLSDAFQRHTGLRPGQFRRR